MPSVVLVHNTSRYLLMHYREFMEELLRRDYRVTAVAPNDGAEAALRLMGVDCRHLPMSRRGMNPFAELRTVWQLWRTIASIAPDAVLNFSIKPILYGTFAARAARVRCVLSMVTGLGYVFTEGSAPRGLLQSAVTRVYRFAFRQNDKVFFQNPEDRDFLATRTGLEPRKAVVLDGTGVDVEHFAPRAGPVAQTFLFAGRLLADKGVREYVEAARRVRQHFPGARFLIAGPYDHHPTAIRPDEMERWTRAGSVEYLEEISDLRHLYAEMTALVLPSYREGMPRVVLEAMAMGRAVIASDVPGCRQAVQAGVTGLLVPARDAPALAGAILSLLQDPARAARMGQFGRQRAIERYDARRVAGIAAAELDELVRGVNDAR